MGKEALPGFENKKRAMSVLEESLELLCGERLEGTKWRDQSV